jgi:excisionase family DNA binding protein
LKTSPDGQAAIPRRTRSEKSEFRFAYRAQRLKVHHLTHIDILASLTYPDRMAQLMQVRQAARALGVHENTLRRWEERGLLRAVRLPSGVRRFRAEDVEAMREQMFSGFAPLREDEGVVAVTRARSID